MTKNDIETLLARLDAAGSTGLDMSPGDSLCKEAARVIRFLLTPPQPTPSIFSEQHKKLLDSIKHNTDEIRKHQPNGKMWFD